ncbi:cystatin-like [Pelobates fuscus]|uniref:cystatin-like n=1 Tax=Pelobates fuscus TaxID=191477 RepID=UPI002FE449DD
METFFKVYLVVILAVLAQCDLTGNRESPLLGNWLAIDEDNEEVQKALQFAVTKYNKESNGEFMKVNWIISALQKVVAGMRYKLRVAASIYKCTVSGSENCKNLKNSKPKKKECVFQVYTVAWKNLMEVTRSRCFSRK